MKGILFGVGVGPGDAEMMTLKSLKILSENSIFAFPVKDQSQNYNESAAFKIAAEAVPQIKRKILLPLLFPMTKNPEELEKNHKAAAQKIESYLNQGKNVVFLTLGDVSLYSTFSYIKELIKADGYKTEMSSGIPSFCAAAARLGITLAEEDEIVHIAPASRVLENDEILKSDGNFVIMKAGSKIKELKEKLLESGLEAKMIENCGLEDEKIYQSVEDFPDSAGYFSLVFAQRQQEFKRTKSGCTHF